MPDRHSALDSARAPSEHFRSVMHLERVSGVERILRVNHLKRGMFVPAWTAPGWERHS
jgi:hypothetical protein